MLVNLPSLGFAQCAFLFRIGQVKFERRFQHFSGDFADADEKSLKKKKEEAGNGGGESSLTAPPLTALDSGAVFQFKLFALISPEFVKLINKCYLSTNSFFWFISLCKNFPCHPLALLPALCTNFFFLRDGCMWRCVSIGLSFFTERNLICTLP